MIGITENVVEMIGVAENGGERDGYTGGDEEPKQYWKEPQRYWKEPKPYDNRNCEVLCLQVPARLGARK